MNIIKLVGIESGDTYEERLEKINKHIEENDVSPTDLELLGGALLKANDVCSNRKLENRFWVDEREFGNYAESKRIVSESSLSVEGEGNVFDFLSAVEINPNRRKDEMQDNENSAVMSENKKRYSTKEYAESIKARIESVPIKERTSRMNYILNNTEKYIQELMKETERGRLSVLRGANGVIKPHNAIQTPTERDFDVFEVIDIYDEKHVRELVKDLSSRGVCGTRYEKVLNEIFNEIVTSKDFTKAQKSIALLVDDGLTQSEISSKLSISRKSVSIHLMAISKKLIKKSVIENALENIQF